ncbi:ABC transporter ATP-binding protein [Streptomyces sp. NPDC001982]|uniref:ABC transporter ATP-binding protein n=1 Tax=Streptomyces sp. NPDC001982 TaxID=3154405 RepID=UPI003325E92E
MTSLLEFDDVSLGYGQVPVVTKVNLHVEPGEIVALLGRNGAGKTTTLLTASGLVAPMAGRVQLLGQEVDTRRPHRNAQRGLGHVPDNRCLFTRLTVAENLRAAAPPSRIKQALTYFPMLEPLMGRRAGLLSGGEQQMLAIARAVVAEPKVLLIDEMSIGLAPLMARAVLERLGVIVRELGVGVLIVEQFVHMILRAADRAYVYGDQGVALSGSAREVLGRMPEVEAAYLGQQG